MGTDPAATNPSRRTPIALSPRADGRSALLLAGAAVWALWVVGHYYVVDLTRPQIADGVLGGPFPYWREAALRALSSLTGVAVTLLAAWGAGQSLLWALSSKRPGADDRSGRIWPGTVLFDNSTEHLTFALACGFVVLSSLCLALASLHVYRPPVVRTLLVVAVVAAVASLLQSRRARGTVSDAGAKAPAHGANTILDRVTTGLLLLALAFALAGALAPEIEYDALSFHLWLPQQWLETGAPVDIVHEYVSLYPLSWELLYGVAMTVGGAGAAKLLHFACLPLLAGASWLLTRSLFPRANPGVAAALAVVSPIVMWEAATAYIDLPLALFLTLSVPALWATPLSSFQLRFVIPLVPVLAAFSAAGLAHLTRAAERLHPRAAGIVVLPFAIVLLLNLPPFTQLHERDRDGWQGWLSHVVRVVPGRVVLGAVSADRYLQISVPSYPAWRFINQTLPRDSRGSSPSPAAISCTVSANASGVTRRRHTR